MREAATRRRYIPIRVKLGAVFLVLLLATAGVLILYFPDRMALVAQQWAERGATGTAEVLASAVAPGVEFSQMGIEGAGDSVRDILAKVHGRRGGGVLYAVVLRPDR